MSTLLDAWNKWGLYIWIMTQLKGVFLYLLDPKSICIWGNREEAIQLYGNGGGRKRI